MDSGEIICQVCFAEGAEARPCGHRAHDQCLKEIDQPCVVVGCDGITPNPYEGTNVSQVAGLFVDYAHWTTPGQYCAELSDKLLQTSLGTILHDIAFMDEEYYKATLEKLLDTIRQGCQEFRRIRPPMFGPLSKIAMSKYVMIPRVINKTQWLERQCKLLEIVDAEGSRRPTIVVEGGNYPFSSMLLPVNCAIISQDLHDSVIVGSHIYSSQFPFSELVPNCKISSLYNQVIYRYSDSPFGTENTLFWSKELETPMVSERDRSISIRLSSMTLVVKNISLFSRDYALVLTHDSICLVAMSCYPFDCNHMFDFHRQLFCSVVFAVPREWK